MNQIISNSSKVKALAIPSKKWKGCLSLCMMLDMFSFEDMLNFFVEGEDEPHLGNKELPKE
jgi:hypothetical protein